MIVSFPISKETDLYFKKFFRFDLNTNYNLRLYFECTCISFKWAIKKHNCLILSSSVFRPLVTVHALLTVTLYPLQFHSLYLCHEKLAVCHEQRADAALLLDSTLNIFYNKESKTTNIYQKSMPHYWQWVRISYIGLSKADIWKESCDLNIWNCLLMQLPVCLFWENVLISGPAELLFLLWRFFF